MAPAVEGWRRAIKTLNDRIERRFLDSAKRLSGNCYAGFAILALDCLLIETIQAFRKGKNAKSPEESRDACKSLQQSSRHFASFFSGDLADRFFTSVRNELLHDGEIRDGWLVKASPKYALIDPQPSGFTAINRRKLHDAVVAEFKDYVDM